MWLLYISIFSEYFLSSRPSLRKEEQENRVDFQATANHSKGQQQFGKRTKDRKSICRPNHGADIVEARENPADNRHEIIIIQADDENQRQHDQNIGC